MKRIRNTTDQTPTNASANTDDPTEPIPVPDASIVGVVEIHVLGFSEADLANLAEDIADGREFPWHAMPNGTSVSSRTGAPHNV